MSYSRELVEQVKSAVLSETAQMRELNRSIPVTGTRYTLQVKGRKIPIVYYRANQPNAPLIVGFHGGGFLFGGAAMNDAMWSAVAEELGCNVASVDYRKSPDYQYMDALLDAVDASEHLKEHREQFGHSGALSVMGCSAGANIAAAACIYARSHAMELYERQILLYPFLDLDTDPAAKGPGSLEGPIMQVFNELHCPPEEYRNPLVSPVFAGEQELVGLPKALIVLADHDNLKAEGERYAVMLRHAGVSVKSMVSEGMPHGFFESGFGELSEIETNFLGEEVVRLVRSGVIHRQSVQALQFLRENW